MWRNRSPTRASSNFKPTNPIESMISINRDVSRNVKRWSDVEMDLGILKRALAQHEEVMKSKNRAA